MSLLLETNGDCLRTMNGYDTATQIFIYVFVFFSIWYILIIRPNKYCIPCNNSKSAVWAINLY